MFKMLALGTAIVCSTAVAHAQETQAGSVSANAAIDGDFELDKRRDQGWNAPWGFVFSFNNILQNGRFLDQFQDVSVAGTYIVSPDFMIRAGGSISRSSNPSTTTETSLTTPDGTVKTYTKSNPGTTSSFDLALRAEALWRLTRNKVAPYIGGGPYVNFGYARDTVTDDVSVPNVTTSIRNRSTSIAAGLRAVAGAEWRIHSNFAFFAEYGLSLDVVTFNSFNNATSTTTTVDGVTSGNTTRTKSSHPTWLNLDSGLQQGATLGLIVFF